MTSLPHRTLSDPRFRALVSTLRVPGMGTEAVAPYLAALIHFLRPQRVLEVGRGYTTPFIAGALQEVEELVRAETRELAGKTQPYLDGGRALDEEWLYAEPSFARPGYYLDSYQPEFVAVDDLSIMESSADRVGTVLKELGLDETVTVIDSPLALCDPLLPESFDRIDLAWVDAWECLYFIDHFWERINPDGGVVLMHYLMSYPEGEAILEYLRTIQQSKPGEMEIVNLLEPHKMAQNSITMIRRVDGYQSADYAKAGTYEVDLHQGLLDDAEAVAQSSRTRIVAARHSSPGPQQPGAEAEPDAGILVGAIPQEDVITLEPAEAQILDSTFAELAAGYEGRPLDTAQLFIDAEAALYQAADSELVRRLIGLRTTGSRSGGLLIRGLPVDRRLPDTPRSGRYTGPWQDLAVSTLIQIAVMGALGGVISYQDEKCGDIVQDVCPVPGAEDRQENTGSGILELHTEDGFHTCKPDFLSLYCLRQDHRGHVTTLLVGIHDVLPQLSQDDIAQLRRSAYRIRPSSSFAGAAAWQPEELAVLTGPADDPHMCVDYHAMEALDDEAADALRTVQSLLKRKARGVVLAPGDLLVIDNHAAAHGRTAFTPNYDGTDRWLRRCFAITGLRESREYRHPGSRILRPLTQIAGRPV